MEDYGEKILEVRHRPFGVLDGFFLALFLCVASLFAFIALDKSIESIGEMFVVWGFCVGMCVLVLMLLFMDRKTAVFVVYENGIFSNKFKLRQISFIHWEDISDVSVRFNCVHVIPCDKANFSEKTSWIYRSDSILFGEYEQYPIMLRFYGTYGVYLYDIDVQSFAEVCNSALKDYRRKHALA